MHQLNVFLSFRFIGATPDSLKYEEDTFHKIEMDLARGLRRVFRKGRGMTFQQLSQILSPRSSIIQGPRDFRRRSSSVRRRLVRNGYLLTVTVNFKLIAQKLTIFTDSLKCDTLVSYNTLQSHWCVACHSSLW